MSGRQIMTADEIRRATVRLSHEIVEKQAGTDGLLLIGIQRRGVELATSAGDSSSVGELSGARAPAGACENARGSVMASTHIGANARNDARAANDELTASSPARTCR